MPYEWNPMWLDICDPISDEYVRKVRAMIMASINWMDAHPKAHLEWAERSKESLMKAVGHEGEDPGTVSIICFWSDQFKARNAETEAWFKAMVDACEDGPTGIMLSKAMACGQLFATSGWEEFSTFMMTLDQPQVQN